MDSILRTKLVYEVADSFESTKSKIDHLIIEHSSGKMEEDGTFSYQANFYFGPRIFGSREVRIVYGKGRLEADGKNTLIHFTISPNLGFVFLILLIFPIICLLSIFDNQYLLPGGKNNIWHIMGVFLIIEGVIFSMILISTYLLKLNFQQRFDLSAVLRKTNPVTEKKK
jgi:hypothetical protein